MVRQRCSASLRALPCRPGAHLPPSLPRARSPLPPGHYQHLQHLHARSAFDLARLISGIADLQLPVSADLQDAIMKVRGMVRLENRVWKTKGLEKSLEDRRARKEFGTKGMKRAQVRRPWWCERAFAGIHECGRRLGCQPTAGDSCSALDWCERLLEGTCAGR
eukprot:365212-Chlamydomonas_euryale.AAC.8